MNNITVTFDQPVILNGTPNFTTDLAGQSVTAATQTAANAVQITYSGMTSAATKLNLPYCDPAIRNASGGYVTAKQYALAA